jgi:hypothetical protein
MQDFSKAMGFLVLMKTLSVLALSDPQMFTLVRLVIDDYFAIAQVPVGQLKTQGDASFPRSKAHEAFRRAKDAYASENLKGSDLKDIIEQTMATVIGAEIDSRAELASKGLVAVGAPSQKRLALSWMCLEGASLAYTTDAFHASLAGSLVSAFCFRRCAMCLLSRVFAVIPPKSFRPNIQCFGL